MLAQLGDVYVHRTGVEVVVVDPDGLEGVVALENHIDVCAEQRQQFRLLGGEFCHLVIDHQYLFLSVESEFTYLVHGNFFSFLTLDAAQDGLDAHGELFHGEGLGDVVVGAEFEAFEDVFLERLGGEEDDGHIGVECADFWASVKPSFLGIITSSTQMSYLPLRNAL